VYMSNQDDTYAGPIDISQLKWALRHGKTIDSFDHVILPNEPFVGEHSNAPNIAHGLDDQMDHSKETKQMYLPNTILEEKMANLGEILNQEIVSLRNECTTFVQSTLLEEQIDKLTKVFSQEILSLRNEFAVFVQAQLQQEKAWKIAEVEWKNILEEREVKLQGDIGQLQDSVLEKMEEYFRHIDQQLQQSDQRSEMVLFNTSQFIEWQQSQSHKDDVLTTQWQKKIEEGLNSLVDDMGYIQYVVEEVATRPQCAQAQQKLRESFFIREVGLLKAQIASISEKWQVQESDKIDTEVQHISDGVRSENTYLEDEAPTRVYKKKKRRRY